MPRILLRIIKWPVVLALLGGVAFFFRQHWRRLAAAAGLLVMGFLGGVFTGAFWRAWRKPLPAAR